MISHSIEIPELLENHKVVFAVEQSCYNDIYIRNVLMTPKGKRKHVNLWDEYKRLPQSVKFELIKTTFKLDNNGVNELLAKIKESYIQHEIKRLNKLPLLIGTAITTTNR